VFPDPCLHIGGDEVSPGWWSDDPDVAELMQRESLTTRQDVQSYFNRRVARLVKERGRRPVAWDEVLHAELPPSFIVQAWRGSTARDRALARGNPVVVSGPYYLDLCYPVDVHYRFDPAGAAAGQLALEDALMDDPRLRAVADGLRWTLRWRDEESPGGAGSARSPEQPDGGPVLGAEACLWGELVTEAVLDVRLWSRLPALAERFWSSASVQDLDDLYRRLDDYLDELHPLRGRDLEAWTAAQLGGRGVAGEWLELVRMLEPVKWYGRLLGEEALRARVAGNEMPLARPYDTGSPLDSLVDHLPPESRRARQLALRCAAGGDAEALLKVAERWRALGEAAEDAPAGLEPLARRLAVLGELVSARVRTADAVDEARLDELLEPVGELQLAMPPALRDWLLAS
jgi:hexosaminidase